MAVKRSEEKKKRRCVMASDADWARIHEVAEAAGLSISEYILRTALDRQTSSGVTDTGLPRSVQRRLAQAVLVLERLEKQRLENQDAVEVWRGLVAEADAWIDDQTALR